MIGWLRGPLRHRDDDRLIVDAGGVGYEVLVPLGVGGQTALGEPIELFVHTHVREDQIALFGFEDLAGRRTFETLIGVSGVGPRVALAILGDLGPGELAEAIALGDVARLKRAHGVGKRLAERLAVELKGKLDDIGIPPSASRGPAATRPIRGDVWRDLESALANLQYRPKEIDGALGQLQQEYPEGGELDVLLRAALGALRR